MMPLPIELDFVRKPRRGPLLPVAVLAIGIGAATWTFAEYRGVTFDAQLLELELPARTSQVRSSSTRDVDRRLLDEANAAVRELSVPWGALLDELEGAGADTGKDVALLEVEPDRDKGRVRIGAEARSLQAALYYVSTLQRGKALEFPRLESHEVRVDQRDRPVYFELTAEWSTRQ